MAVRRHEIEQLGFNFSGATEYDNTDPQATGLFRDLANPTRIVRGSVFSYTSTIASLAGLQTSGEVGIRFDTADASSRGSVTNFQINSGIGTSTSSMVVGWAEQNPY